MPIDYGTHNISTSGNIVASSGNFSALTVNGNPIGEGGAIVNNFGDNRLLTSTGTVGGINAESNLTFDGTNLGIGTSTPAHKLEVVKSSPSSLGAIARLYHGPSSDRSFEIGVHETTPFPVYIQARNTGSSSNDLSIQPYGGSVGIGTSSPQTKLHVTGTLRLGDWTSFTFTDGNGRASWYGNAVTNTYLQSEAASRITQSVGNIAFYTASAGTAGGAITWNHRFNLDDTGAAWIKTSRAWNDTVPTLSIGNDADGRLQTRHIWGKASASAAAEHLWLQHGNTNNHVQIGATGGANNLYVVGDIYANGYFGGALLLYGASGMRRGVHQITNWNQTTLPDVAFLSSENAVTNAPTTDFSYGIQYAFHRSGAAYRTQLVTSLYSDLDIWVRNSRDSDVWTAWKKLLHSGNYNSYSPTLTGGGASGSWGINITGNAATASNVNNGTLTLNVSGTGLSGSASFTANQSGNTTFTVTSNATSANTASTIVARDASGNFSAGTITATLSGNASTATSATTATGLNSSNYIARSGSSGNANTDFSNTPAGTVRHNGDDANLTNGPGNAWWFYDNYRHSNGTNLWGTQIAWGWEDNANRLAQRNVTGGSFGAWVYYLNSANYNSYAPTLTGGNASGTWGISISGDLTKTAPTIGYTVSGAAVSYGGHAGPQILGQGGSGAIITFHRPGAYAINLGLDTDNQVKIGGWSFGAAAYKIVTADSRNSRGATRLYRNDNDSDYSVQTYWTGARWRLRGYVGDTYHAEAEVSYADSAGTAIRLQDDAGKTTEGVSVKCFVSFAGDSATDPINNPTNNYNIATVDRIATGQYIIYINEDAPHTQYAIAGLSFRITDIDATLKYTWGFYVNVRNTAGTLINNNIVDLIVVW